MLPLPLLTAARSEVLGVLSTWAPFPRQDKALPLRKSRGGYQSVGSRSEAGSREDHLPKPRVPACRVAVRDWAVPTITSQSAGLTRVPGRPKITTKTPCLFIKTHALLFPPSPSSVCKPRVWHTTTHTHVRTSGGRRAAVMQGRIRLASSICCILNRAFPGVCVALGSM